MEIMDLTYQFIIVFLLMILLIEGIVFTKIAIKGESGYMIMLSAATFTGFFMCLQFAINFGVF